jgi:hypothetical protein
VGVTVSVALCVAGRASAGNLDSFPLGNEAAMTGGAVVATTHDAAATWYNPAGLGTLERDSVDGSASAFVYRIYQLPNALVIRFPNNTQAPDFTSSHILSVPTSLITAKQIGAGVSIGVGFFVQRDELISGPATIHAAGVAPAFDYTLYANLSEETITYYAGGALGWRLSPTLRVGIGLFGIYDNTLASFSLGTNLTTSGGSASGTFERKLSIDAFSTRATAGLQYDPDPAWSLGLVVRSPRLGLTGTQKLSGMNGGSRSPANGPGQSVFQPVDTSTRTPDPFDVVEPTRIHAGFAHHFRRGWIGFSSDYQFPLHDGSGTRIKEGVWNTQVGGRAWILERVAIGAGLFTDRSAEPHAINRGNEIDQVERVGSSHIDYTGATLGVEYRHIYSVLDRHDAARTGARGLEFSTTLAGRYALGHGTIRGNVADPLVQGPIASTFTPFPITVHEIALHIGSALYF